MFGSHHCSTLLTLLSAPSLYLERPPHSPITLYVVHQAHEEGLEAKRFLPLPVEGLRFSLANCNNDCYDFWARYLNCRTFRTNLEVLQSVVAESVLASGWMMLYKASFRMPISFDTRCCGSVFG